jgi:hypothetical protein
MALFVCQRAERKLQTLRANVARRAVGVCRRDTALALAETDPVKADILHWIADNYAKPPSQDWLDAWRDT